MTRATTEQQLHAARAGELGEEIMSLALDRARAVNGALFLWDPDENGLVIEHHIVGGLTVTIPNTVLRGDSESPGIALRVFETDEPYLCANTRKDPHYTRYLLDVGSIAAVPIRYQDRPIGVITVSDRRTEAFTQETIEALEALASTSTTFLRRAQLDQQSRKRTGQPFLIKGLSSAWLDVESKIERVSPTTAPILIRGESGTGKDLVANAIHFNSRRSDKPLVTVNCAAIPETMLESILFGHVKGAFTGASFDKLGEFQKADGGSLFLDEVGELPVMLQAKVLRAVEQGEVQPLGSNKAPERVDVRLICATNRDLEAMAREGKFRDDLYYRLGVMTMDLPPLRSYKADNLEVIAHVFVQQSSERMERKPPRISEAAMSRLRAYEYPGNVRELKNAIEHAVIMCHDNEIKSEDLPRPFQTEPGNARRIREVLTASTLPELREKWLAPLEHRYLARLLDECDGNVREAAKRAGVNAVTMYRLLRKRGIRLRRQVRAEPDD